MTILHLAGPAVSSSALVYLYSSAHPTRFTAPFTVASGTNNSPSWNLGQNWFQNLSSYSLTTPDNLTISVVTQSELLFRTTLPGLTPNIPPTFTGVGTIPAVPNVGAAFTIFVQISDNNLKPNSVFVNLSLVPGNSGTGLHQMTYSPTLGAYTYNVPAGFTKGAGSYYVFVNATDQSSVKNSVAFLITLSAASSSISASIEVNNTEPVSNSSVGVTAFVANGGSSATTIAVTFAANGATVGTGSSAVASGGIGVYTQSWTPTMPGVYLLTVLANASGGVVSGASLNLTVFPKILVVGHNVPSGVKTAFNESAFLRQELTADGFPYTSMWVSCSAALPASTTFNAYNVVVIDFGSTWVGGCPKFPSTTEEAKITGANAGVGFLVLGSNAFGTAACSSYNSAYFARFAIGYLAGSTCVTLPNATAAATFSGTPAAGVRSDGIPSSMTFNKTLGTSSNFVPYDYFTRGTTNTAFLKASGNAVGAYMAGAGRNAAIAADPALLAAVLPNANNWGTGQAGASVVYNAMNFLCYFSTSSQTGRALPDYGIAQATLVGQSHALFSTIYVGVRANGPVTGLVSATLYVNGSVALYQGTIVASTVTVSGNGGIAWISLLWTAPAGGPFTLSVVLSTQTALNLNGLNNQMPLNPLNLPTTFT